VPSQITVTGKTGPAQTVTSLVISNVLIVDFALAPKSVLTVQDTSGKIREYDLAATTTITFTISAGVGTIVLSQ